MNILGVADIAKRVAQLGVRIEGQRVLAVRPVQPDGGDAVLRPPNEVLRAVVGHAGHASPSQLLRNDLSLTDSCPASRTVTRASSSSIQLSCAAAMSSNAERPLRVRLTKEVRRSPLRCARTTKPSDTRRSTIPVTLPFDTMRKREISLINMPSR